MWISKDVIYTQKSRSMANAVRAIEIKVLEILSKLTSYRLNMQVYQFLLLFREFQEKNLDPHVANEKAFKLEQEF